MNEISDNKKCWDIFGAGYRVLKKQLGNGVYLTVSYDEIGRPVSWHWHKSDGSTIIEFRYAHDREGNRWYKRIISPGISGDYGEDSVELYRYDEVYRVTGVKYGVDPSQIADIQNNTHELPHPWDYYTGTSQTDYELDGVGNRKTVLRDGQTETYVTNSVNEYVYVNNQRLLYDANGNLLDDGEHRLYYNHNNQVVKADRYTADPQFMHIKMWQYDVLGRRLKVWFANQLVEWARNMSYDGQRLLAEWREIASRLTTWLHIWVYGNGIDEVLVDLKEGVWYLDDALGSVYVLTDDTGNVVEAYQYDIYGQPRFYDEAGQRIERSQYGNVFMFTGRYWEGPLLHLYYYRARYYSPRLGCFVTNDPIWWGKNPAELYLKGTYQYCWLRPTVIRDATGMQPQCCVNRFLVQHWGWIGRQGIPPMWNRPDWEYRRDVYYGLRAVIAYFADVNNDSLCQVRQWLRGKIIRYNPKQRTFEKVTAMPNVVGGKLREKEWSRDGVVANSSIYEDVYTPDRPRGNQIMVVFDRPGPDLIRGDQLPALYSIEFKACIIDKKTKKSVSRTLKWTVVILLLPPCLWSPYLPIPYVLPTGKVAGIPGYGPPFGGRTKSPEVLDWFKLPGTR